MRGQGLLPSERTNWYLNEIVRPTIAECVASQADVRRAVLAAVVVSHLTDHVAEALLGPMPDAPAKRRRKLIEKQCGDLSDASEFLKVVRHVANAMKHVAIDVQTPAIDPPNLQAVRDHIHEVEGRGFGAGPHGAIPGADGKFRYGFVVVRLPDGREWAMHGVVQEAMWFLERQLSKAQAEPPKMAITL